MKKIFYLPFLAFYLFANQTISGQKSIDKNLITGSWIGKINTGAIQLRIVINLLLVEKDSLIATLDSPDQGAKGIKLGQVQYNGTTIKISADALLAEYNGTIENDTLIEGTWKQGGASLNLNLIKLRTAFI